MEFCEAGVGLVIAGFAGGEKLYKLLEEDGKLPILLLLIWSANNEFPCKTTSVYK
jgi:hypothetical protein